jgi:curved DNA-binding protein
MTATQLPDYFEILQVSPRADRETIERVFRHLAKRYHPDNRDSGNADTFSRIVEAYRVLTDPEQRARYDLAYEQLKAAQWRIFDQETTRSEIAADARIRNAILALMYVARRNDCLNPAIGAVELERTLDCPESLMAFHVWYLREQGLIKRDEDGGFAITAAGVDRVLERGGPLKPDINRISAGEPIEGPAATAERAAHPLRDAAGHSRADGDRADDPAEIILPQ